jgi:hypothetical protein
MSDVSQGEVLRQIDRLKQYVREHQSDIPDKLYEAMNGFSKTFLAYRDKKGSKGWASNVLDPIGNPLWTGEEAEVIQEALPLAVQLQVGGSEQPEEFDPSIDSIAENIHKYLASIDEKNRQLASIIGPVALVNKITGGEVQVGPLPPYLPIPISITTNMIVLMITVFLETCRLLVSNNFFDISILRQILSLVLSVYDVLRGEWRSGVLSFMGVFSQSSMIFGMIGKTARFVYSFISPDIQDSLESNLFAGGKSMFIGFWLWVISIISPKYVQESLTSMMDVAKQPLEVLNQRIDEIEQQAQLTAPPGTKIVYPRIPMDKFPTFDDIQSFQTIVHRPEVYCSPMFQQVLAPALTIPVLKLVIELLNIPTSPEGLAKACQDQPKDIVEAITKTMKPVVVPLEPQQQTGGNSNKRFRRTLKRKKQSSS